MQELPILILTDGHQAIVGLCLLFANESSLLQFYLVLDEY